MLLCTEAKRDSSIFSGSNRAWLEQKYGIRILSLKELAAEQRTDPRIFDVDSVIDLQTRGLLKPAPERRTRQEFLRQAGFEARGR